MLEGYFLEKQVELSVPISGDIRTLLSTVSYFSPSYEEIFQAPIGLNTDLGSIPPWLQGIFPKDGKAMFAYILHDHLYKSGILTRKEADDLLEEAMKVLGVSWWRRRAVREGLRVGGWVAWNKHRKVK